MTLKHMRIFLAVCQEKSITKASQKLHLSQPAVSVAIKELEDYYGIALFERISRKLFITEAGKRFYDYTLHIVSLFDEMETMIKDWDTVGKLRIGASITIGTQLMPQFVKRFKAVYQLMDVLVTVDSSETIERKILTNQIDFGLIEGSIHYESIVSEPFMDDNLAVVCGKDHPLAQKDIVRIEDLKEVPFLIREKNSGTREIAEQALRQHNFGIAPAWESTSTQAIVNAVAEGLGFSILPQVLMHSYKNQSRLKLLKVEGLSLKRQFLIIYHRNKFLTPAAKEFMNLCRRCRS